MGDVIPGVTARPSSYLVTPYHYQDKYSVLYSTPEGTIGSRIGALSYGSDTSHMSPALTPLEPPSPDFWGHTGQIAGSTAIGLGVGTGIGIVLTAALLLGNPTALTAGVAFAAPIAFGGALGAMLGISNAIQPHAVTQLVNSTDSAFFTADPSDAMQMKQAFGIAPDRSVDTVTNSIMQTFDANRDGTIGSSEHISIDGRFDGSAVFAAAAAKRADGVVTKQDLRSEIATFDKVSEISNPDGPRRIINGNEVTYQFQGYLNEGEYNRLAQLFTTTNPPSGAGTR